MGVSRGIRLLILLFASGLYATACDSQKSPNHATADADDRAENAQKAPKIATLPPPPGDPGPFLIRTDDLLPNQIFGAAATLSHIAVAIQSDVGDISLCTQTQLPICFRGSALIAQRRNPGSATIVSLYESDTQSGSHVDGVESVGNYFAFAIREGVYAGDTPKQTLAIFHQDGAAASKIDLTRSQAHCSQIAIAARDEKQIIACQALDLNDISASHRIACQSFDVATSKPVTLGHIETQTPVRSLAVAPGFDKTLIAWTAGAHAYVAFLDRPDDIVDLGPATALRPSVARGADRFVVAWQGDDGMFNIDAVFPDPRDEKNAPRQSIRLNGVRDRSISSLVPFSQGYAFAFRYQNTQQIAVVDPDLKTWHLADNSNAWRIFSQYGALDIQNAHYGRLIWQTVESLIQKTSDTPKPHPSL